MPRGRYPKRLYSTELDEETLNRYRFRWSSEHLHFHPETFPPITAKELFGVDKKLAIEIGCGDGKFLCELAKHDEEVCFLGIDVTRKLIELAASNAAKENLSNIRFLHADLSFLAKLFLTESVNAFYLHFPAPFDTKRNFNRQTYSKEILLNINRALIAGGRFSFITDDKKAFDFVCEQTRQMESFHTLDSKDYHLTIESELKSTYHKRWERRGRTIHRAEFEKINTNVSDFLKAGV